MDLKLLRVKLIFNSYKTTSNKLALTFDQTLLETCFPKVKEIVILSAEKVGRLKSPSPTPCVVPDKVIFLHVVCIQNHG